MNITKNFSLDELVYSFTAYENSISNDPNPEQTKALVELTINVLQPIRDKFGLVYVTSGYRSPQLNKLVGGVENSQHLTGHAVDFKINGDMDEVYKWIQDNLQYDQLILYRKNKQSWIHVSYTLRNESFVINEPSPDKPTNLKK